MTKAIVRTVSEDGSYLFQCSGCGQTWRRRCDGTLGDVRTTAGILSEEHVCDPATARAWIGGSPEPSPQDSRQRLGRPARAPRRENR